MTYDEAAALVIQCESWDEFQQNHQDAYNEASRKFWVDDLVLLCEDTRFKWTFDLLLQKAQQYQSRNDFAREATGAYITARDQGHLDAICTHMD